MSATVESLKVIINGQDNVSHVFEKVQGKADSSMSKLGAYAKKAGVALAALGATAGVGAAVGIYKAVGAASDMEETASKFGVVFKEVGKQSEKVASDLQKNFGLSGLAAKRLLGDTGDLLSGFGFTGDKALEMSKSVNELAVDLASFTNAQGGAEAVSDALTKALLGEREALKTYGIAIMEADVQAKLLEKGQADLTGEALRQAKAQATLELAYGQSKNAVGDFARTQDSFANQSRIVKAKLEDISVSLGEVFLPIATKGVNKVSEFLDGFKSFGAESSVFGKHIQGFKENMTEAFEIVGPLVSGAWGSMKGFFDDNKEFFFTTMKFGGALFVNTFKLVGGAVSFLKNIWDSDFGHMRTNLQLTWAGVKYFGTALFETFGGLADTVGMLSQNWEYYWESMKLSTFKSINSTLSTIESFINKSIKLFNSVSKVTGFQMDYVSIGKIDTEINEARVHGLKPKETIGEMWSGRMNNIGSAAETYINDVTRIVSEMGDDSDSKQQRDQQFLEDYRQQKVEVEQHNTYNLSINDEATADMVVAKIEEKNRNIATGLGANVY